MVESPFLLVKSHFLHCWNWGWAWLGLAAHQQRGRQLWVAAKVWRMVNERFLNAKITQKSRRVFGLWVRHSKEPSYIWLPTLSTYLPNQTNQEPANNQPLHTGDKPPSRATAKAVSGFIYIYMYSTHMYICAYCKQQIRLNDTIRWWFQNGCVWPTIGMQSSCSSLFQIYFKYKCSWIPIE